MKLSQIKQIISSYDSSHYIRKSVLGTHERIKSINQFLDGFKQADDYTFSTIDRLHFAQLLCNMKEDYLPEVYECKKLFENHTQFFRAFNTLQQLTKDTNLLIKFMTIPQRYLSQMQIVFNRLHRFPQQIPQILEQYFTLLLKKIPRPEVYECVITAPEDSDSIQYSLDQGRFQLQIKNESSSAPLSGGRASIMTGTIPGQESTKYCLKKLNKQKARTEEAPKNTIIKVHRCDVRDEAAREVKYSRFFNREAYYFQHDQQWHVISTWQEGHSLNTWNKEDLIKIPQLTRIKMLKGLTEELKQLHDQFRVHGDIKSYNCVLNPANEKLTLIDFGTTRKVKPKEYDVVTTPCFLDTHLKGSPLTISEEFSFCDDIYALGFVVASLFPEFYTVSLNAAKVAEAKLLRDFSSIRPLEKAVYHLVNAMLTQERNARCTAAMVIDYCSCLMTHHEDISNNNQSKHLEIFLNSKFTADDILHDHYLVL